MCLLLLLCFTLLLQACKAAASAIEQHSSDAEEYYMSAHYCQWQLQHAAALLTSHVQLGFKPPGHMLMALMPALMLHLGREGTYQQQQQQQQEAQCAREVLEVLATLGHHPGKQV
jgi:hypothetical protein